MWCAVHMLLCLAGLPLILAAEPAGTPTGQTEALRLLASARGFVSASRVNLRSGPGTTYNIVMTIDEGTELTVYSYRDGWFEVDLPAGASAWVYNRWVRVEAAAGQPIAPGAPVVGKVVGDRVRIRAAPDMLASVLAERDRGQTIEIVGQAGDWYKVKPPAGTKGWIYSKYIDLERGVRVAGMSLPETTAVAGVPADLPPLPEAAGPPLPSPAVAAPQLPPLDDFRKAEYLLALVLKEPPLKRDFREVIALYNRVIQDAAREPAQKASAAARLKQLFDMLPRRQLVDYMLELSRRVEGELKQVEKRYGPQIEAFRSKLPPARYTARGTLYPAEPGQRLYRYRLKLANVTLYLIRTQRTDLDRLLGREVGVIGQVKPVPQGEAAELLELAAIEPVE